MPDYPKYSVKRDMGRPICIMHGESKIIDLSDDSTINSHNVDVMVDMLNSYISMISTLVEMQSSLVPNAKSFNPDEFLGLLYSLAKKSDGKETGK